MTTQTVLKLTIPLLIILGAISALTPIAIDMYLPAMPAIAGNFGVDAGKVQLTLTAYTAGFALGQMIHGPLADSFGRKPVILIGTSIFALVSVFSAYSTTIENLIILRCLQGFAGATAAVVIQAIVRDMFNREEFVRTMAFVVLIMTVAPLVAPLLGGHIAASFGWRAIFLVIAAFAIVVMLCIYFVIPETLSHDKRQTFSLHNSFRNYALLIKNKQAMSLILVGAFSFSGMFAFLTAGSFIYINKYGVDIKQVGYLFALNTILMIVMTSINGRFVKQKGSRFMLSFALTCTILASFLLVLGEIFNLGLWGVVLPVMLFVAMIPTIGSNCMALLLSDYPHITGTAASLAGTFRFGLGALAAAFVAALPGNAQWPMVFVMASCGILSTYFYVKIKHTI